MTIAEQIRSDEIPLSHSLEQILLQYPLTERETWRREALRLAHIVSLYAQIKPKRHRQPETRSYEFTPEVRRLCEEARCHDPLILAREPHRDRSISPYTLDDWLHKWRRQGPSAFLRRPHSSPQTQDDRRRARISTEAIEYLNQHWRQFRSPRALYRALVEEGEQQGWEIPSEAWLYRRWQEMPQAIRVRALEGRSAYEARCAPYVPRNYEDLAALQVVCGDHSERDVTVLTKKGELLRPWLTAWQCLRTGLIWGWYLSLRPSSQTARLAYADGVLNFGAQPFARPAENFYSYIYTDRGKDYSSHDWAGKIIAVHQQAINPDAEFESLLIERQVGVLAEFGVKRLLARGYNAKEKPIERFFKDLSGWEANIFTSYCGPHPQARPRQWHELFRQHQQFINGRRAQSPFISLAEYQEKLKEFINRWHHQTHERVTLGAQRLVPLAEFHRLYKTRYEMRPETVALALLKAESRVVRKNGVTCFRRDWSYWHPICSSLKGQKIEIRFTEQDYRRIWLVLPDRSIVVAQLITPTPLLNPNQETLQLVARARQQEKKLIDEFQLLAASHIRGESIDERVHRQLSHQPTETGKPQTQPKASIHRLSRLDRRQPKADVVTLPEIDELSDDAAPMSLHPVPTLRINEFDHEE